jgi:DNA helicase-4
LKRIKTKPLLGFLTNPFGIHPRSIEYHSDKLRVVARRNQGVDIAHLATAPSVTKGYFGSNLQIDADDGATIKLRGVRHSDAETFSEIIKDDWINHNTARFESKRSAVELIQRDITELSEALRYPSACSLSSTLEHAQVLDKELLSKLPQEAVGTQVVDQIQSIQRFVQNAGAMRDQAIERFETQQLPKWKTFFDTFESNPLTPEQRISILADEDATLVLAGAGSGKTSVITAKAGYLIKSGIRQPEEILLLAFARDAAKEMSERIEERCGEPLEARTFHALAYDIIGAVEGSKPALAAHATDDKAFMSLIKDILRYLVKSIAAVSKLIIGWFSYARLEGKTEWDFQQKHDYYTYVEKLDLRTLQGEQVKSFEELMIANWLFENGIEYEYEPNYEHKVSEGGYRDYCPDFRLTNSGVYIEHFGVRRTKKNDGTYHLTTAPFVDREEYLEGMTWKREVHDEHDTTLIETFSYEREEGRLLEALAEKIAPFETPNPRSQEALFDIVVEMNQADSFAQLIGTFLRHYKGGGYQLAECADKAGKMKLGRRARAFLSIFEPLYAEYQKRLDGRIDFEDMILKASDYVERGTYRSPFKHILVDEFQDISRSRGRLVKALKAQHHDARVFAVGDDWQSIYRFAGSDINLMRSFGQEFGGAFDGRSDIHRVVDLGRTFRSVDQIAYAAKKFVLQNPAQLDKAVIPAGTTEVPALKVVSTFRHDADEKLKQVLRALHECAASEGKRASVLLLGRYRYLAPSNLPQLRREFSNLDISFRTIHSSKVLIST